MQLVSFIPEGIILLCAKNIISPIIMHELHFCKKQQISSTIALPLSPTLLFHEGRVPSHQV